MTGSERLAWDQELIPESNVRDYRFEAYLDGARVSLPGVTCTAQPAGVYADCAAPLPPMSPGNHQLRIVAIRQVGPAAYESVRSGPLLLVKLGAEPPAPEPQALSDTAGADTPGGPARPAAVRVDVIASTLRAVADVAATEDGRIFVAERTGRLVLVTRREELAAEPLLAVRDVAVADGLGVFSIALHPEFGSNGLVYFAYAAETAAGPVYRVVRGRELAGRIGQLATLLEAAPAAPGGWAVVRFGRDGKLYAAFGEDETNRDGAASYGGKVLRLNDDGTMPDDNPRSSLVVAAGVRVPGGLVWTDGMALIVHAATDGRKEMRGIDRRGGPLFVWPSGARPAGLAYTPSTGVGTLGGELLVPMLDGGVERLRWEPPRGSHAVIAGPRLAVEYGSVRGIAVAPDGRIYAGTANGDAGPKAAGAASGDFLLRFTGQ